MDPIGSIKLWLWIQIGERQDYQKALDEMAEKSGCVDMKAAALANKNKLDELKRVLEHIEDYNEPCESNCDCTTCQRERPCECGHPDCDVVGGSCFRVMPEDE